jgi:phage terminase large subunit-like protein
MAVYGGTRLAAQELEGLVVEGAGALWTAERLAACRGEAPPREALARVVVAVDPPAGGLGADASACGIVVAGRTSGPEGRDVAWVLSDRTVSGSTPQAWAERVGATVEAWGAAAVVAEINQGGDMVAAVLRAAGCPPRCAPSAPASASAPAPNRCGALRTGRLRHAQRFRELEEQLMAVGEAREDRADAWCGRSRAAADAPAGGARITRCRMTACKRRGFGGLPDILARWTTSTTGCATARPSGCLRRRS